MDDTLELISQSPDQTRCIGECLGSLLRGGEIIGLEGDLGAGKTVLAQGVGLGWGTTTQLISPTFVLVRRHDNTQGLVQLYHIDLYRLGSDAEVEGQGLGVYDLLGYPDSICLIEWPERAPELFTDEYLWITLRWLAHNRRALRCHAVGTRHSDLLRQLHRELVSVETCFYSNVFHQELRLNVVSD